MYLDNKCFLTFIRYLSTIRSPNVNAVSSYHFPKHFFISCASFLHLNGMKSPVSLLQSTNTERWKRWKWRTKRKSHNAHQNYIAFHPPSLSWLISSIVMTGFIPTLTSNLRTIQWKISRMFVNFKLKYPKTWPFSKSVHCVSTKEKESLFYLTMLLEHIDFHIIGYWTSSTWSLWHFFRGNSLLPHRLLFPIGSKGCFICGIPQTSQHIRRPLMDQL